MKEVLNVFLAYILVFWGVPIMVIFFYELSGKGKKDSIKRWGEDNTK